MPLPWPGIGQECAGGHRAVCLESKQPVPAGRSQDQHSWPGIASELIATSHGSLQHLWASRGAQPGTPSGTHSSQPYALAGFRDMLEHLLW